MIGKILNLLKKLFDPRYTDRQVRTINDENKKVFDDTAKSVKRHTDLLKKNGVMMRIHIATGGDRRGH